MFICTHINLHLTDMKQGSAQWHAALPPLGAPTLSISPSLLSTLSAKAALLHQNDTRSSSPPGSEASFLSKIIHSGTLSDRLSALTLLVQSSPLHNTKPLESLKAMAERGKGKGGREESLKALRCIVDWWVGGGAPDRKLKYALFMPSPLQTLSSVHLGLSVISPSFIQMSPTSIYSFGTLKIGSRSTFSPSYKY